jgi:hypothetical protein
MKSQIHEHRDPTMLIRVKGIVSSPNTFQSIISFEFNWHPNMHQYTYSCNQEHINTVLLELK